MRVTVDTTEARSFDLVEPGPYPMTVEAIGEPKAYGEKNTMMVDVNFRFQDPNLQQKSGDISRLYPIAGKGAGFFREFWKASTGQDLPIGEQLDVDLDDAIGRPVICDVGHREYQGRNYNEVKTVIAES